MTHAIISYKYWLSGSKNPEITYSMVKIDGTTYKEVICKFWDRYHSNYFTNEITNVECYPSL